MRTSFAGRSRIDSESGRRPFQSRGFDLVLTMVSLPLLLPLMGIIALGLFLSGGRIVDRDECVGKDGTRFQRYRFCTTAGGENGRSPNGTRFGRMVQRINLAGLPELFNVLRGEMSLVGPRPRAPSQLDFYGRDRILLLQIRPGIVSPAQLYDYSGYNETAGLDCVQNVQIELAYQQVRTPLTDLSLLLQANAIVVAGRERLKKILGMRNRQFLMIDILSILSIPVLVMSLRMEGFSWWPRFNRALLIFIGAALLIKLSLFFILSQSTAPTQ